MTDMTRNEFLRGALASFGAVGARCFQKTKGTMDER